MSQQERCATAQEEYWALIARRTEALQKLRNIIEDIEAFYRAHVGETFKVFNPQYYDGLVDEEIESWDL